jgi:hypothetical protein
VPYLPLDLDAKRKLEAIERGLSLPRHTMVGGAMDLWESVWRAWMESRNTETAAIVDELAVCSAFGSDPRIRLALVARDFLEPLADGSGWRVCGAAKWLFGLEGKSRGGKAAKANLRQGSQPGVLPGNRESQIGDFPAKPGPMPEDASRLDPRLLHPAPSTQHHLKETSAPVAVAPSPVLANPVGSLGALTLPGLEKAARPGRRHEDRPAPAKEPPRLKSLTTALAGDVLEILGEKYLHGGARDTDALKRIVATGATDREIRSRFRAGLRTKDPKNWLCVRTIAQLGAKWNDLAGYGDPPPDPDEPLAPTFSKPPKLYEPTPGVEEIPF